MDLLQLLQWVFHHQGVEHYLLPMIEAYHGHRSSLSLFFFCLYSINLLLWKGFEIFHWFLKHEILQTETNIYVL